MKFTRLAVLIVLCGVVLPIAVGQTGSAQPLDEVSIVKLLNQLGAPGLLTVLVIGAAYLIRQIKPAIAEIRTLFQEQREAAERILSLATSQAEKLAEHLERVMMEASTNIKAANEATQATAKALESTIMQARELLREAKDLQQSAGSADR